MEILADSGVGAKLANPAAILPLQRLKIFSRPPGQLVVVGLLLEKLSLLMKRESHERALAEPPCPSLSCFG